MRKWSDLVFIAVAICGLIVAASVSISVAQDSLSDADVVVTQTPVLGTPTAKSLTSFRTEVLAMASKQVKAGEISRVQMISLRFATMSPKVLEQMHQACAEQALADGAFQSYGAIDWTKLRELITEMLPVLLQLLKLFS
jgi:hypothetical protein